MKGAAYIHLPWDYLSCTWFQELDAQQTRLFAVLYTLARMDKRSPERCVCIGMRRLGKEIGMSHMTAKRTVDGLVKLRVIEVVAQAEGRAPATYKLAKPVELFCTEEEATEQSCVTDSCDSALHNTLANASDVTQTVENYDSGGKPAHDVTQEEVCVTGLRENALHLNYSLTGECTNNSPVLGTQQGESCVPHGSRHADAATLNVPTCPRCHKPMERTNMFLPNSRHRIWKCKECWEEHAVSDEELASPTYSAPKPTGVTKPSSLCIESASTAPMGGQDRAMAHDP